MSKNRMIVERDRTGQITCQVTSSTHGTKSRTNVVTKGGKYYLRHNSMEKDVPVVVVFKAMGITSDQEIVQMVGTEDAVMTSMAASLEECNRAAIFTQNQALRFIAAKLKAKRFFGGPSSGAGGAKGFKAGAFGAARGPFEDARDILATTVLAHVPAEEGFNFKMKAVFMALMVRRVVEAQCDDKHVDDR